MFIRAYEAGYMFVTALSGKDLPVLASGRCPYSYLAAGIQGYLDRHTDARSCTIKEPQFDIFGFSRGAAAARHFANRVFSQDRAIVSAIKAGLDGCGVSPNYRAGSSTGAGSVHLA